MEFVTLLQKTKHIDILKHLFSLLKINNSKAFIIKWERLQMIQWEEAYRTNNDLIDGHHKELFRLCNELHKLHGDKYMIDKYDKIVNAIEELKDYTKYHFDAEEQYMISVGYNRVLSHKVLHNDFIEKLDTIDYKRIDMDQDNYLLELLAFAVDWIIEHILTVDKLIDKPNMG